MSVDLSLLEAVAAGRSGPVFRLYTWHPPAVSLGYHQRPERELDLAAVAELRIDVVVRPTGGRALLHDTELTYAIVAPIADPRVGGSVAASHAAISRLFQAALARLGVVATLAGRRPAERPRGEGGEAATPCFATATPAELLVGGRKILGSAQRRLGSAFLQHGSLLLGDGHLLLADLLRLPPSRRRAWRRVLEADTTTLGRALGRPPRLIEVVDAVAAAVGEAWGLPGLRFTPPDPSLYCGEESAPQVPGGV